jgi:uncharacterized RDD family membrane protein YckC
MSEKVTVVIESVVASWLRDFGTFGAIGGAFYINHVFMDGNPWLSAFLLFAACVGVVSVAKSNTDWRRFDTKAEAAAWLTQPEQNT